MATVQSKRTRYGTKGSKQSIDKEITIDKPQPTCPDCNEVVSNTDKALTCDICEDWYHIRDTCQNVPFQVYEFFDKNTTQQIHWYCKSCNKGATNLLHMMNKTSEAFDKKIKIIDDKVDKMGETMTKSLNELLRKYQRNWAT
jgi:hypothetical protein